MRSADLNTIATAGRILAAAVLLVGVFAVARAPVARLDRAEPLRPSTTLGADHVNPEPSSTSTAATGARNPFRPAGWSTTRRFDPTAPVLPPARRLVPDRKTPAPRLSLNGLVHGARPLAILEGVPDRSGASVLGEGDEVGGLMLLEVLDAGARVRWADSVWVVHLSVGGSGGVS